MCCMDCLNHFVNELQLQKLGDACHSLQDSCPHPCTTQSWEQTFLSRGMPWYSRLYCCAGADLHQRRATWVTEFIL